ncbi:MAG: ABC transporter ATP-binding protein [Rhizobiaceae bacterium]|nr:ABC transporter ATP-binding protein [Rhizobiaceae bacterium]
MSSQDIILQGRGLTKSFGGFFAVNGVDIGVRRGAIHSLIGPNGAGKTTLFNLLTKIHLPSSGQIFLEGAEITSSKPQAIARKGMVRSFQISACFQRMTVLENVRVALQRPTGLAYRFWRADACLDVLNDRARELLASVGLEGADDAIAGELPYGRKRALEIATTLALDPKVLLLDEPMAGLGREDIALVTALIRRISKGRTTLLVEHNMKVVAELSDTITVLQRGEVIAEGAYDEISQLPEVREAYLGADEDG